MVGGTGGPRLPARAAGRRAGAGALPRAHRVGLVCPGGAGLTRPAYAELHAHSNFSFLDGASHPEEMAARAAELGLRALAITDHDGVYGAVRFSYAARELGLQPIVGMEALYDIHKSEPTRRRGNKVDRVRDK
ncbi:MAG: PHP domain-containing protein, partial [Chloroflexi bacterium]|nr:PHP domain-containing protein [Chloroflexota bacterium]